MPLKARKVVGRNAKRCNIVDFDILHGLLSRIQLSIMSAVSLRMMAKKSNVLCNRHGFGPKLRRRTQRSSNNMKAILDAMLGIVALHNGG